ncbi:MAG: glycoside hydrolase family 3 N-terminal domain-containing protein [Planctomycetota bacterium]
MNIDQAIGRLLWVGIRGSSPGDPTLERELDACAGAHVGGIILFDVDVPERTRRLEAGDDDAAARLAAPRNIIDPQQTRALCAYLRERLGEHLIISIDQEGGRVARLNPARGFPESPAARDYAALPDDLRHAAAGTLARTVADAGIDMNLAPCIDVAVNPDGPGHTAAGRSFGRDPRSVAQHAAEQIDAMHAEGVACTLKHFPGHGSARGDTHMGLVDITDTFVEDDELVPYHLLLGTEGPAAAPADSVMVSHLVHRGFDPQWPCSLSRPIIHGLLRERMGFDGLVLTDSLDMRAIADRVSASEAAVRALEAGADIALEANNLFHVEPCPAPEMHGSIRSAIADGRLSEQRIMQSVERLETFSERMRARRM